MCCLRAVYPAGEDQLPVLGLLARRFSFQTLEDAFGANLPNSYIYAQGIGLMQADALAAEFAAIDGVDDLIWLGDVVDIRRPLETYDADIVKAWKSDEGYL